MDELIQSIRSDISSIWRFRWWAMLAVWSIGLAGFAAVAFWPDEYEARAVVFVDAASRLDEVIGGVAIEWDIAEQLNRVRQAMLSRPVLEAVARDTDLHLKASTPQEMSALIESLRDRIGIDDVRRRVPDPRLPTDSVLTISFSDTSRETALLVVETLLDTFVRDVNRSGQGASDVARTFLLQRIADYEEELRAREDALARFKRDNVGLLPGDSGDYFARLQAGMEELESMQSDLSAAENRRDALRAQLSSETPTLPPGESVDSSSSALAGPLDSVGNRIIDLEDQLDELLLRFTDQHPDVIATREQLARLRLQQQESLAALAGASGGAFEGSPISTNPVYQSIQIALNDINVEIAELRSRIDERRLRVADLREKVDVIPQIEARLAGLVRDYDQVTLIHGQLVGRLEQERLGTAAVTNDTNFSVLDPPVVDFYPTSPNRLLLLVGVFIVSLSGGGALGFGLHVIRPVFSSSRTLREFTGLPVLGTISLNQDPAKRLVGRFETIGFGALCLLFTVTFAVLVTLRQEAAALVQGL